ncbi:MAG: hypothetical protein U0840_22720 [Gemmataceae bacterium]
MNQHGSKAAWIYAAAVGLFAGCYLLMGLVGHPDAEGAFKLEEFGRLPVVDNGRVKPIDTLARVSLMVLSGRQEYKDDKGETQPATKWLLEVMTAQYRHHRDQDDPFPGESHDVPAYRIDNEALRQSLGLDKAKGVVFSFRELYKQAGPDRLKDLMKQAAELVGPDAPDLTENDRALAELASQIRGHITFAPYGTPYKVFRIDNDEVLALLGLEAREGFRYSYDEFLPRLGQLEREARRANKLKAKDRSVYDQKAYELFKRVELYVGLARGDAETLHLVAPATKGGDWRVLPEALAEVEKEKPGADSASTSARSLPTWWPTTRAAEPAYFNQASSNSIRSMSPRSSRRRLRPPGWRQGSTPSRRSTAARCCT